MIPAHSESGAVAMSYRRFTDSEGRAWEAWEVHPVAVERRMNLERRAQSRDTDDRRQRPEFRLVIPRELRSGWLALQDRSARIRLTPIPDGWVHLSDEELAVLVARAREADQRS
jgi:hypothetical protein